MKTRPILFSAPMVSAILAGTKTQTRRLVTPRTAEIGSSRWEWLDWAKPVYVDRGGTEIFGPGPYLKVAGPDETYHRVYPRFEVGQRLWVRETWAVDCDMGDGRVNLLWRATDPKMGGAPEHVIPLPRGQRAWLKRELRRHVNLLPVWRPSIFLPRWASRLRLEITEIRAQKLQDITYDDIRDEGIACPEHDFASGFCVGPCSELSEAFRNLWDSLNKQRASWESDPWVFVLGFRVIK